MTRAHRLRPLLVPLTLLLLAALFYAPHLFSNLILARGDTYLYFYPYWHAAAAALRAGRLPLWNPDLFMGAPLLANSQVGFFYPLNWPVWWLLPVPQAVSAAIVLHVLIAAWGTYRLARDGMGNGRFAATLAAVLFAFGGYLSAQVEHVNQLQGLAWLPWLLWALRPGGAGFPPLRRALPAAAFLALQLLAGHTQTTFISGVGAGLWLLAGAWRGGRIRPNRPHLFSVWRAPCCRWRWPASPRWGWPPSSLPPRWS